jgi:hypothetical protein
VRFRGGLFCHSLPKTTGQADASRVLKAKTARYAVQNIVPAFNGAALPAADPAVRGTGLGAFTAHRVRGTASKTFPIAFRGEAE